VATTLLARLPANNNVAIISSVSVRVYLRSMRTFFRHVLQGEIDAGVTRLPYILPALTRLSPWTGRTNPQLSSFLNASSN
jgi:hypothetical protein